MMIFEWLFFGTVIFLIWKSFRGRVWKTVPATPAPVSELRTVPTKNPLIRDEVKWNPTKDGEALVWEVSGTILGSFICFCIAAAIGALLYSLWQDDPTPAPPSYILVDHLFPPWHHPFDLGSYVGLFFNFIPLLFFALGLLCLFGKTTYRLYPNQFERRSAWLGFERRKRVENAALILRILSEKEDDPNSAIWEWQIEIDHNGKTEHLFSDAVCSGGYLGLSQARAVLAELSRVSRWPIKEMLSIRPRPQSSSD